MKTVIRSMLFVLAMFVAGAASAETRIGKYDNATVYLYDTACPYEGGQGLKHGKAEFHADKVSVPLCYIEKDGLVWIVMPDGVVTTEDPKHFKPALSI